MSKFNVWDVLRVPSSSDLAELNEESELYAVLKSYSDSNKRIHPRCLPFSTPLVDIQSDIPIPLPYSTPESREVCPFGYMLHSHSDCAMRQQKGRRRYFFIFCNICVDFCTSQDIMVADAPRRFRNIATQVTLMDFTG